MMSLVSTPLSVARVAAPKKAIRKTVTAKASAADAAKSAAVAGALALTIAAQPALALGEVAQIGLLLGGLGDAHDAAPRRHLAAVEHAQHELLARLGRFPFARQSNHNNLSKKNAVPPMRFGRRLHSRN